MGARARVAVSDAMAEAADGDVAEALDGERSPPGGYALPERPQTVGEMQARWESYVRVMEAAGGDGPRPLRAVWAAVTRDEVECDEPPPVRVTQRPDPREVMLADQMQDWLTALMAQGGRWRVNPRRVLAVYYMATWRTHVQAARHAGLTLGPRQMFNLRYAIMERLLAVAQKRKAATI